MSQAQVISRLLRQLLRHPNPWVRGAALAALLAAGGLLAFQSLQENRAAPAQSSPAARMTNGYEKLTGVRLVEHRNNDGDSFRLRQKGRQFELRLYFVDTPEKYLSDRYPEQQARVAEQARDLRLTREQTVALGQKARNFVQDLLKGRECTVYTKWERVFDSERVFGFVELADPDNTGRKVYLCELLLRRGLGRVHTQGAETPDGRSEQDYRAILLKQMRP